MQPQCCVNIVWRSRPLGSLHPTSGSGDSSQVVDGVSESRSNSEGTTYSFTGAAATAHSWVTDHSRDHTVCMLPPLTPTLTCTVSSAFSAFNNHPHLLRLSPPAHLVIIRSSPPCCVLTPLPSPVPAALSRDRRHYDTRALPVFGMFSLSPPSDSCQPTSFFFFFFQGVSFYSCSLPNPVQTHSSFLLLLFYHPTHHAQVLTFLLVN